MPDRPLWYQDIVLMVGEGNFVATLCRATWNGNEYAQADIFRLADGLIVTGKATGASASQDDLELVRNAVPDRPLFVGSGVTVDNAARLLNIADGIIVGTSIKHSGRTTEPASTVPRDPAEAARVS